jgi:hypothetical protein
MKIETFPDEYDIREVIQYYTMPYAGVKRFLQEAGILFAARGKEPIARFAQNLVLEYRDYRKLQTLALSGGAGNSISGFTLSSDEWLAEGIDGLFQDIVEQRNEQIAQHSKNQSSAERPHFEELSKTAQRINGRLDYQRVSPGKVELLNKAPGSVEFQIEPVGERLWQVTCFPDANKDVLMLGGIFSKMANGVYHTKAPLLEPLEIPKRIEFCDALLLTEFEDWRFEHVTGITVRQPEDREPILIEEGDEEQNEYEEDGLIERQPTQSDLRGITQAILKGRRLRTNSFVKDCEKQGFYFPSMTIQYRHKREPEVMNLTVRFKLKPQMFEIAIEETFLVQELEQLEPCTFEWQRQQEILYTFWGICNRILDQLTDELSPEVHQPFLPKSS